MQSPTVVLPDAVDEAYYQSFAVGKAAVELMPSLAHLSADGVGDADGAVDVGQGAALLTELVGWAAGSLPAVPWMRCRLVLI